MKERSERSYLGVGAGRVVGVATAAGVAGRRTGRGSGGGAVNVGVLRGHVGGHELIWG